MIQSLLCYLILLTHFLGPQHRCRNQGIHDLTSCSTSYLPSTEWDPACSDKKPGVRFCHIPALNEESTDIHFSFTPYSYFTSYLVNKTCDKMGGKAPDFSKECDALWPAKSIEYLSSFVRFGRPWPLKWLCWPVRRPSFLLFERYLTISKHIVSVDGTYFYILCLVNGVELQKV